MKNERELILSFVASLTLCDHMGDVSNEILEVLERLGETELVQAAIEGNDFDDLQQAFYARGIKTLCGTALSEE